MGFICPGCTTEMDPMSESCPVCMRGRSRKEIFASMREKQGINRKWYVPFRRTSLKLLAALAAGWFAMPYLPAPKVMGDAAKAGVAGDAAKAGVGGDTTKVEVRGDTAKVGVMGDTAKVASPGGVAGPPHTEVMGVMGATTEVVSPPGLTRGWTVSGRAYDLLGLKPVAGATVSFKDKVTGKTRRVKTDKNGRYKIRLEPLEEGGYAVAVRRNGYESNFLEERHPPYSDFTPERREEEAALARQSPILHLPILPDEPSAKLEYSVVLIPIPEE